MICCGRVIFSFMVVFVAGWFFVAGWSLVPGWFFVAGWFFFLRRVIRKIVERESVEAAPSRGSRIGETCVEYVAIVVHQQNISDSGNRVRFGWGWMGWGTGVFSERETIVFCCSISYLSSVAALKGMFYSSPFIRDMHTRFKLSSKLRKSIKSW